MLKKTIEFDNFNGDRVVKDFYFHLSKADLIKIAANGNLDERIRRIMAAGDDSAILHEFELIVRMSVGIRSEDGNAFLKTPEAQAQFMFSPAYDVFLMELLTDANAAAEFVNGLVPEKMKAELNKEFGIIKNNTPTEPLAEPKDDRPAWIREDRKPTVAEVQTMTKAQLQQAIAQKLGGLDE